MSEEMKAKDIDYILEKEMSPDRYCYIHNYMVDLQQKVEQLENIRKEALEYVVNNSLYDEKYEYDEESNLIWKGIYDYKAHMDLLNILNKGSDKE